MAERRRGREWSHPPWSPRPRNAHEGPWNGLYPAGYKLVRRAPHARKGLALDRNEAQTKRSNTEYLCDLFDDVTDLGAPSSPAPLAHRFAAAGLDRAPKSVTRRLSRSLNATEIPLTAAPSYKSRTGAVAWGRWPTLRFPSPLIELDVPISGIQLSDQFHREAFDVAIRGRRSRRSRPHSPWTTLRENRRVPRPATLCRLARKSRTRS